MNKLHHLGTQILEVDDFILRPFIKEDLSLFHLNIASNHDIQEYFLMPYISNMKDTERLILQMIKHYSFQTYNWVIASKESNEFIGIIRLFELNEESHSAEIGYAISKAYWNQGIATKVLKRVIRYLFEEIGFNRLYAGVMIENKASKKVLENAGMRYEGIRYQEVYWKKQYHDVLYYYLLREQY